MTQAAAAVIAVVTIPGQHACGIIQHFEGPNKGLYEVYYGEQQVFFRSLRKAMTHHRHDVNHAMECNGD